MEKFLLCTVVIIVLIVTIGINVSDYMVQKFQIECVKSGGTVETVSVKYNQIIQLCQK